MSLRGRVADDRGETLLELVISIMILGVCVVAIGSGIALSVLMSDVHRKQSVASEFLHNYAETLRGSTYLTCSGATPPNYVTTYNTNLPLPPNGGPWTLTQKKVQFWDGSQFQPACASKGLEQVTLELSSNDQTVDETIDVIVRDPNAT